MHASAFRGLATRAIRETDMRLIGGATSLLARILARRAWLRLRGELAVAYRQYRASGRGRLPPLLVTTLLAAEDPRFRVHRGIDLLGFVRAIWKLRLRRTLLRGGTLESRLVRVFTARWQREPGLRDAVRAIVLSGLVETVVPKPEIPAVYLTFASFGWQMEGALQACRRLGFDPGALTPLQAASIVARLRYPEPEVVSFRRARRIAVRAQHVLRLAMRQIPPPAPAVEEAVQVPVSR
jgi:penicillin-binding protein 1A